MGHIKYLVGILLLITANQFSFNQELETKSTIFLARFPKGSGEGQFGIDESPAGSFPYMPTSIAFDDKGNLYANDAMNNRIQVFDSNFSFVRSIADPLYSNKMDVKSDGSYVSINERFYVESTSDGIREVVLKFESKNYRIARELNKVGNVYFWEDESGELRGFINPGSDTEVNQLNLKKGESVFSALSRLGVKKQSSQSLSGSIIGSGSQLSIPTRPQNQGTKITLDGKIVSKRIRDLVIFPAVPNSSAKSKSSSIAQINPSLQRSIERGDFLYFGTDNLDRTYWFRGGRAYLILDNAGIPFRYFNYEASLSTPPFVSKEGDLYFLKYVESESQFHLMKVVRDW